MNLIEPPKRKLFAWIAKNTKAVADYLSAVFQLSRLTANLMYQGATYTRVVTYNGRNATLNLNLDFIESAGATSVYAINYIFADYASAVAGLAARAADCLVAAEDGFDITNLSASAIAGGLSITNTTVASPGTQVGFGMDVTTGDVVMAYSITFDASCSFNIELLMYDDEFTLVDSATANYTGQSSGGGSLTVTAPSDGFYRMAIVATQIPGPGSPTSQTMSASVTQTDATASNVVALWTDGSDIGLVPCA